MYDNHPNGTLAENIIAVSFCLDGTVTPIIRRRESSGKMVSITPPRMRQGRPIEPTEFVARVEKGNSAVAAIGPSVWKGGYAVAVVPLGDQRAQAAQLFTSANAAAGKADSEANDDEVWFRYADGKLTWRSENVSGESVINETYPELTVALRLPPGNHGEISFASPLFTTADGEPASVLSVA